jgi:hypothetical protein
MSNRIAHLKREIESAEQRQRYYDAAEGRQYRYEAGARLANEAQLTLLHVKLADAEYAEESSEQITPDRPGLECSEAMDSCDREACGRLLRMAA